MENKFKDYVRNLSQIKDLGVEDIGIEADLVSSLRKEGIPVSAGFVITAQSFDDFLSANDFIDPIGQLIHSTDYDDPRSVKETAKSIETLIMTGTVPMLIKNPIIKLYNFLGGENDAFVNVSASSINEIIGETATQAPIVVRGEYDLLEAVKYIWAELFSAEALSYRNSQDYEGFLTTAILVQKSINSDISGEVYTVDTEQGRENVIEIRSIWGISPEEDEIIPDRYWYDFRIERIINKMVIPQENMYVRTDKTSNASFGESVPISLKWRKKQKLDDNLILKLAHQSLAIKNMYDENLIIHFDYVAGVFFISDVRILTEEDLAKAKAFYTKKGIQTLEESLRHKEPSPKEKAKQIEELAAEIYHDPLGDVEVFPMNDLTQVITGRGNKQKPVFGFAAYVVSSRDWLEVSADKILIIERFEPENMAQMNSARGVICKSRLSSNILSNFIVPVIHDVDDIDSLVKNKEVITIEPARGAVYLGAGVRDESEDELDEADPEEDFAQRYLNMYKPMKVVKAPDVVQRRKSYVFDPEPPTEIEPAENQMEAKLAKDAYKSSLIATEDELKEEEERLAKEAEEEKSKAELEAKSLSKDKLGEGLDLKVPEVVSIGKPKIKTPEIALTIGSSKKRRRYDEDVDEDEVDNESEEEEDDNDFDLSFLEKKIKPKQNRRSILDYENSDEDEYEESDEDIEEDEDEYEEEEDYIKPQKVKNKLLESEIEVDEDDVEIVKTSTDFWQIFDPSEPFVESANVQGIIVSLADIYDLLEISPFAILEEKRNVVRFITNVAKYIVSITEAIGSKYIIVTASNYTKLDDSEFGIDRGGAEAIVADSSLFEMELRIIRRLRNKERLRNVWFSVPDIRRVREFTKIKKLISDAGLRRSATFKVLATISSPLALISIQDFIDSQVDGIMLDLDDINYQFNNPEAKSLNPNITKLLGFVISNLSQSKLKSYLVNRNVKIFKEELDVFIKNGLANLCLEDKELLATKRVVANLEVRQLQKKRKRGRKTKKITYGF